MAERRARPRVMVVDDDAGLQHAVTRILEKSHEVRAAAVPREALELAAEFRPDLAIIDIYMPEMNGFELMRQLRDRWRDLDFIIMTGDTAEPDANLIRAIEAGAFYFIQKPFDRQVLLAIVSRCLELRRLRQERQKHVLRMERELEEARRFQLSFLPPEEAHLAGLRLAAHYLPCEEVAGDFFDYALTSDQRLAMLVADVVGHGASAAMMTGVVKSAFQAAVTDNYRIEAVIRELKRSLIPFEDTRFVTVFTALLDPQGGSLEYANAGHPPAVIRSASGHTRILEATGSVLGGAMADFPCRVETSAFARGDTLVAYTDGLAESDGPQGMFGHTRIRNLIANCTLSGRPLLEHLMAKLREFTDDKEHSDDVTLMVVSSD